MEFLDTLSRVVGPKAPSHSQAEHLGQESDGSIGLIWGLAQGVVEALDVCGLYILNLYPAQAWQNVLLQNAAIVPDASSAFFWQRMLLEVAICKFRDCWGFAT
jgi:hypothetical protein